jgi:hypothetical protein
VRHLHAVEGAARAAAARAAAAAADMAAAHAAAAEVAAMAASQTKARAAAAELRRQEEDAKRVRVQQRGMGYSFTLAHDHASAEFSKRCGTTHSFASVKHVAFFGDGDGFFLSRDNGRSYWTGLPSGLSENLLREGKNVQGELTYAVGVLTVSTTQRSVMGQVGGVGSRSRPTGLPCWPGTIIVP